MRLSTSASCLVGLACASAEMYFAPTLSRAPLIAASSVFQRSSWKFDQETPTVRSFAEAAKETRLADASNAAPSPDAIADFIEFPPLHVQNGPLSTSDRLPSGSPQRFLQHRLRKRQRNRYTG